MCLRCTIVLGFVTLAVALPARSVAFDYFEHRFIGDAVCADAEKEAGVRCNLTPDLRLSQALGFGDLVAMAGDHFGSPHALEEAVNEYVKAAAGCTRGEGCPKLWKTRIGKVLAAREIQGSSLRGWIAGQRLAGLKSCVAATPWLGSPVPGEGACVPHERPTGTVIADRALSFEEGRQAIQRALRTDERFASVIDFTGPLFGAEDAFVKKVWERSNHSDWGLASSLWDAPQVVGDCYVPDEHELAAFARLPDYAELASANRAHFGRRAEEAAVRHLLNAKDGSGTAKLCEMAFGLHYLTDRHAAGHMRTRRGEIPAMEALRRHDYDNRRGLIVAVRTGDHTTAWQASGDTCLLGANASVARDFVLFSAREAFLSVVGLSPVREISWPVVALANLPVAETPRLVSMVLEPAFGAGASVFGITGKSVRDWNPSWAAAVMPRWRIRTNVESVLAPPELMQLLILDGNGTRVIVPLAADPGALALWAFGLSTRALSDRAQQWVLRYRHLARDVLENDWFNPRMGLAFVTWPDQRSRPALYVGNMSRWRAYDRVSFGLALDAVAVKGTLSAYVGANIGIELL